MFFLNKYIIKILIIISFYNIFSILVIIFSPKIDDYYTKIINYLPYKHSIFFMKPLMFNKEIMETDTVMSKKLFQLINKTENKSVLDYKFWEIKLLYQINNSSSRDEFERNFINLIILSKNNPRRFKSLKLYYLRNVPRFSNEVREIVMSIK